MIERHRGRAVNALSRVDAGIEQARAALRELKPICRETAGDPDWEEMYYQIQTSLDTLMGCRDELKKLLRKDSRV